MAAQPEHQASDGHRHDGSDDAGKRDGPERRQAGKDGEREQDVGAEADIGLLADRDEAGVAGEQIPKARQRHIGVDLGEEMQVVAAAPQRRGAREQARLPRTSAMRMWLDRLAKATRDGHVRTLGNSPSAGRRE